jgi:beta-glucosidase
MTAVQNATTGYDERINTLDLRRKVALLTGASVFTLAPEESIGLSEVRLSDGPTGVRGLKFSGGATVALFPNATLLASAWSEDTAYEVGSILAEEAMAQEIHVVLGPTINLHRSLLGGRVFEAYSEDPLLSGKLAAAYVRGLQDNGVGACLKHLVANESETERNTVNSVVDEATLRELYLLPFEIAVADADAWSVMAAYNDVNGVPATEHDHIINRVLKDEWSYTGLVMSDWFATKTAGPAANGGLDLVMPGPAGPWGQALVDAVESGEVAEAVVDDHLRRLLRLADRVGALGTPRSWPPDLPAPDSPQRREQLTRLAAAGMTVLTNRDDTLPLPRGRSIALIGRHAVQTIGMGGGSAQVNAPYQVSVAEGLTALLGGGGNPVTVTDGVEVRTRPVPARAEFVTHPETGEPGLQVILLAADGSVIEERHSTTATTMIGFDDDFEETVHTARFRARITAHGPVEIGAIGAGTWRLRVGDEVIDHELAVSGTGFGEEVLAPPTGTSEVVVDGDAVIDGTMFLRPPTATDVVDAGAGTEVDADVNPLSGAGMFGLIAHPAPRPDDDAITDAVAAAAAADVAVVSSGSPRNRRPSRSTSPRCGCPAARTRWCERSPPRPAGPSSSSTRPPRCSCHGSTTSKPSSGLACPGRNPAMPSPPPCSATSSPPAAWSPPSPPPTAPPPPGRSHPSTGSCPTARGPSSATGAMTPAWPRRRRSGSATASATPRGSTGPQSSSVRGRTRPSRSASPTPARGSAARSSRSTCAQPPPSSRSGSSAGRR